MNLMVVFEVAHIVTNIVWEVKFPEWLSEGELVFPRLPAKYSINNAEYF